MKNNIFYNTEGFYRWNEQSFQQDRIKKLTKELERILSVTDGLKILDVASGTGEFIFNIYKKYPNNIYYGCDIANNVIKQNKKKKKILFGVFRILILK